MRQITELGIEWPGEEPPPPPTDDEVERFERHFGIKLPPDYLMFLHEANGGFPSRRIFRADGEEWTVNDFYFLTPPRKLSREEVGLAEDEGLDFGNLWHETPLLREVLDLPLIPFAADALGDAFVLDFREQPPTVAVVDFEQNRRVRSLARNFSDFLDMLC